MVDEVGDCPDGYVGCSGPIIKYNCHGWSSSPIHVHLNRCGIGCSTKQVSTGIGGGGNSE